MKNKFSLDINIYSVFRGEIMGFAAIMILVCHIVGNKVFLPGYLDTFFTLGNYGVDIFMFLSGIGMYYSICNNKTSVYSWYKKRLMRMLIPYLLISVPYSLLMLHIGDFTIQDIFLNITALEFWVHHRGAWFVSAIIPLYIVVPLLPRLSSSKNNRLIIAVLISAIIIVLSKLDISQNALIRNIQFVIGRTPMFFFGYYIAEDIKNKEQLSLKQVIQIIIVSLILYGVLNIYTALTIPMLVLLGYAIEWICKSNTINRILKFMGKISLESYLTNIYLGVIFSYINFGYYGYGNYLKYTFVLIAGIPLAYYINKLNNKITNTKK